MSKKYLRYKHLKEKGIVNSRASLRNRIKKHGFPPGRLIGPNTRAWTDDEIDEYMANRPVEPKATPPSPRTKSRDHASAEPAA